MFSLLELQQLYRSVGFPENTIAKIAAIAMYESGGNPNAINDGSSTDTVEYSVGLLQINTRVHKKYSVNELKNPIINAQEALRIYKLQGWNAWYNSNIKYKNNYRNIASESRRVYTATTQNVVTEQDENSNESDFPIEVLIGLGLLILLA